MEGQEQEARYSQEDCHPTEPGTMAQSMNESLPSGDNTSTDSGQHDLSYLVGPPFVTPGQTGEPKRYFQGLAENAETLGISKSDLLRSDAQSPFHSINSATEDHSYLPVSLQPTRIQHRYPHHPFWDCIPIPTFRDRSILAAAVTPPLINRFDVCWDLFAGGLTYDGDACVEDSWVFSNAFREKWEALFNFDLVELERRVDLQLES